MSTDQGNTAQIDYWNAVTGQTWATLQMQLDRQLAPLGQAAISALSPQHGERLLDIGCGCGATSLALAKAVGSTGHVLGLDISEPMLEVARARQKFSEGNAATFRIADAQTAALDEAPFDAAFSRFGVMFFADPTAAFANIRAHLKPDGRLTFVCWRRVEENPWMGVPMAAAAPVLPPLPESDPEAPGPFAFANPDRVTKILTRAGFTDIRITPFDTLIGSGDLDETLGLATKVGPLSRALREHPECRDAALGVVRQALAAYVTETGVMMPAAVWIVTATRG
jgi:SAM-dependent methyltransferase